MNRVREYRNWVTFEACIFNLLYNALQSTWIVIIFKVKHKLNHLKHNQMLFVIQEL